MNNRNVILNLLAMAGFALFPMAQAVVPPPDGGYPGFNTAEGQNALFSRTTGVWNTALGAFTLFGDTTGNGNTAVGINVLRNNVAGGFNTGVGLNALNSNNGDPTIGNASYNSALGAAALFHNTTGHDNCAFGANALLSNIDGVSNTAVGSGALAFNTAGLYNTAIGASALLSNTATFNTAVGYAALNVNGDGFANTATGSEALSNNSSGNFNAADGYLALAENTTGAANTAVGANALQHVHSGNANTAIGIGALANNTSGNNNIALGVNAGSNVITASDTICIGITGVNVTDGCYIGHVFEEPLDPDNLTMAIDVHGKVGTLASSRRFKDHIKPMDKTSESILALKPVTFDYKSDKNCSPRFGLIAEKVAEVDPNLVARDKDGEPFSVRYDQVNAMLLNEFLKEHRKKVRRLEIARCRTAQPIRGYHRGVEERNREGCCARVLKHQDEQIEKSACSG